MAPHLARALNCKQFVGRRRKVIGIQVPFNSARGASYLQVSCFDLVHANLVSRAKLVNEVVRKTGCKATCPK